MRTRRLTAGTAIAVTICVLLSACSLLAPRGPYIEDDEDFGATRVYDVLVDGTLDPVADDADADVWDAFTRVTTMEFAAGVVLQYRVGDAPESDILAYVYQDYDNPKLWVLAVNLATDDESQLIATLIHEYGHLLTLGRDQVGDPADSCSTLELDEGCAADDAMIVAFYDAFWEPYGSTAPDLFNTDEDVAYDFYTEHEDDFVSDYAATSAIEDIAETFMTFVLEDQAPAASADEPLVASKLRFFWDYPQMVTIRERIRAEFADELGLAT